MNPIQKLIKIIDKDLCYSPSELIEKCELAGIRLTIYKLYKDLQKGVITSIRPGRTGRDHHIPGHVFINYIIDNREYKD